MTSKDRVALLYAASLVGMGGVAYFRGRRGMDLFTDAMLYGLATGTVVNGVWYAASVTSPAEVAAPNPLNPMGLLNNFLSAQKEFHDDGGSGTLPEQAVKLLASLDKDTLFRALKASGVKVAPVPDNPMVVMQDDD